MSPLGGAKRALASGLLQSGLRAAFSRREARRAVVLVYHRVNDDDDPLLSRPAFPHLPAANGARGTSAPCGSPRGHRDLAARKAPKDGRARRSRSMTGIPTRPPWWPRSSKNWASRPPCSSSPPRRRPARRSGSTAALDGKHARRGRSKPVAGDAAGPPRRGRRASSLQEPPRRLKALPAARSGHGGGARSTRPCEPEGPSRELLGWHDVPRLAAGGVPPRRTHPPPLHGLAPRRPAARGGDRGRPPSDRGPDGQRVRTFAYPNGEAADYDPRAIAALKRLGFVCAVTTRHGRARPGDDPFAMPRARHPGAVPAPLCRPPERLRPRRSPRSDLVTEGAGPRGWAPVMRALVVVLASSSTAMALGFLKNVLSAAYFGTSGEMDAYLVALLLPDMAMQIARTGAFNFIPLFAQERLGSEAGAWRLASQMLVVLARASPPLPALRARPVSPRRSPRGARLRRRPPREPAGAHPGAAAHGRLRWSLAAARGRPPRRAPVRPRRPVRGGLPGESPPPGS